MYQGEVHIGQEQLKEFLKAAQLLQVRGLTDVPPPAPIPTLDQKASPVSEIDRLSRPTSGAIHKSLRLAPNTGPSVTL